MNTPLWIQKCLPQHLISRLVGRLARSRLPFLKNLMIRCFIRRYHVDMTEAEPSDYRAYPTFNAFFTRPLRAGLRMMPLDARCVVSPVDGYISELGHIQGQSLLQAKGCHYDLLALLGGDRDMASKLENAAFFTTYLSPKDYHRVHMPLSGYLKKMSYIPGALFSVNPGTVARMPKLFTRNERLLCYFETEHGAMAIIMVGAMIVSGMETVWHGTIKPAARAHTPLSWDYGADQLLSRGEEMGRFCLGSTVILLLEQAAGLQWHTDLQPGNSLRLGQEIGNVVNRHG